tara:strand:+ start:22 stop:1242 length:1221 start_codon:yes stop_codon:yes gene_type:complete
MYGNTQDPGNWSLFLKRNDIKDLPLMEAKRKFLKEQLEYESFINMQLARLEMNRQSRLVQGGAGNPDGFEDILRWEWNQGFMDVSAGFTAQLNLEFESDIDFVNSGNDYVNIQVPNGQQGNGQSAVVPFTASNVIEEYNIVQFDYIQAAEVAGAATKFVGANVFGTGSMTAFGGVGGSLMNGGIYNGVTYTTSGNGTGAVINVVVATGSALDTTTNQLLGNITQQTTGATPGTYGSVGSGIASTNGTGAGATFIITVGGGGTVTGVTVDAVGSGYVVGDAVISVANASIGGGGQDLQITIAGDDLVGGAVTTGTTCATQGTLFQPLEVISVAAGQLGANSSGQTFIVPANRIIGDRVGYSTGTSGTIVVSGTARLYNPNNESVTIDKSFAASQAFGTSGSIVTAVA